MVQEQKVYQCAKVARSSPSHGEILREKEIMETRPIKIHNTQTPPTKEESSQTHNDMKDNIIAALKGFMSMGIYMCRPSDSEESEEPQDSQSVVSTMDGDLYLQEEDKNAQESNKIDCISVDDYIFEDTSIDEGHTIAPTRAVTTMHSIYLRTKLGPIAEEEKKEEPSTIRLIVEEEQTKEFRSTTRLNDDIFDFSDNEIEPSSNHSSANEEHKEEEEECKEEEPQHLDSIDSYMMGDFDLAETNFYGSKGYWDAMQPHLLTPTQFEI